MPCPCYTVHGKRSVCRLMFSRRSYKYRILRLDDLILGILGDRHGPPETPLGLGGNRTGFIYDLHAFCSHDFSITSSYASPLSSRTSLSERPGLPLPLPVPDRSRSRSPSSPHSVKIAENYSGIWHTRSDKTPYRPGRGSIAARPSARPGDGTGCSPGRGRPSGASPSQP